MRAAVATDTVFDVGYPFLAVLGDDFCRLMLMASVAGVLLVIVIQVTGRAGCIVIAVEQEITAVVECCRLTVPWLVTRRTGQGLAAMQVIARSHVTGDRKSGAEGKGVRTGTSRGAADAYKKKHAGTRRKEADRQI